ncbi:unnamed protein product [Symbiodinium sp. CCMP2592]|nr:unnamed protein product [Symbiodinium sp. CCMP2592]
MSSWRDWPDTTWTPSWTSSGPQDASSPPSGEYWSTSSPSSISNPTCWPTSSSPPSWDLTWTNCSRGSSSSLTALPQTPALTSSAASAGNEGNAESVDPALVATPEPESSAVDNEGITQRFLTIRPGRDRWHHTDGSVRNRLRERREAERLAPISETEPPFVVEGSQATPQGPVIQAKTFYGDAFSENSTTAGEGTDLDAQESDSGATSSSSTTPSNESVGFWRRGEWIARPRTEGERRQHQGGNGMQRWLKRERRMRAYFLGQWRPAWLETYVREKNQRLQAQEQFFDFWPAVVLFFVFYRSVVILVTFMVGIYAGRPQHCSLGVDGTRPVGGLVLVTKCGDNLLWWSTSSTTTTSTLFWLVDSPTFSSTTSTTGVSEPVIDEGEQVTVEAETVDDGPFLPNFGLFPEVHPTPVDHGVTVTVGEGEEASFMQLTNAEQRRLEERGVPAQMIRRVEHLFNQLERMQDMGQGPESRWSVGCLRQRLIEGMDALEGLYEVISRRLLPRGYLPIRRVPHTEQERWRMFNWGRNYMDLFVQTLEHHLHVRLQPGESEGSPVPAAVSPPSAVSQAIASEGTINSVAASSSGPGRRRAGRRRTRTSRSRSPSGTSEWVPTMDSEWALNASGTLVHVEPASPSGGPLGPPPPVPVNVPILPPGADGELQGIWREPDSNSSVVETSTTTTTLYLCSGITVQEPDSPSTTLSVEEFDELNLVQTWCSSSPSSTTTTTSTSMEVGAGTVVREAVDFQLVQGNIGDAVDVCHRLLARQRRLHREAMLVGEATEEILHWLRTPLTAVSFNGRTMAQEIPGVIQEMAASSSSTGTVALGSAFDDDYGELTWLDYMKERAKLYHKGIGRQKMIVDCCYSKQMKPLELPHRSVPKCRDNFVALFFKLVAVEVDLVPVVYDLIFMMLNLWHKKEVLVLLDLFAKALYEIEVVIERLMEVAEDKQEGKGPSLGERHYALRKEEKRMLATATAISEGRPMEDPTEKAKSQDQEGKDTKKDEKKAASLAVAGVLVCLSLAGGGFIWWRRRRARAGKFEKGVPPKPKKPGKRGKSAEGDKSADDAEKPARGIVAGTMARFQRFANMASFASFSPSRKPKDAKGDEATEPAAKGSDDDADASAKEKEEAKAKTPEAGAAEPPLPPPSAPVFTGDQAAPEKEGTPPAAAAETAEEPKEY